MNSSSKTASTPNSTTITQPGAVLEARLAGGTRRPLVEIVDGTPEAPNLTREERDAGCRQLRIDRIFMTSLLSQGGAQPQARAPRGAHSYQIRRLLKKTNDEEE